MAKAAPKFQAREMSIDDAVSEAHSELQQLGEEMRESFDNTPENFQSSGVGEMRGEAADALENINELSVPSELEGIKVSWSVPVRSPSKLRKLSRADRRDDATSTLNAVVATLDEIADYEPEMKDGEPAGPRTYSEEQVEEARSFRDDVQNMIDEAEGVTFPGMYG